MTFQNSVCVLYRPRTLQSFVQYSWFIFMYSASKRFCHYWLSHVTQSLLSSLLPPPFAFILHKHHIRCCIYDLRSRKYVVKEATLQNGIQRSLKRSSTQTCFNYQLNAKFFYSRTIYVYVTLQSSTCFEHYNAHLQEEQLYYCSIWYRHSL